MGPKYTIVEVLADKWWIVLVSLAASLVCTPIIRAVAYRFKIVDKPDDLLKPHGRPIAYLGGVAMWVALELGMLAYLLFVMPDSAPKGQSWWSMAWASLKSLDLEALTVNPAWKFPSIMLACTIIMLVGLFDDLFVMKPWQKIVGQMAAAGVLLLGGSAAQVSDIILNPLFHGGAPFALSMACSGLICLVIVVGTCNATNLLDGLDGLCGGVTGIISLGFLALAVWLAMWGNPEYTRNDSIRIALCLAMVGAVLGFLPYNLPPASIFMGDAGSMLLGFFVATMMCLFCRESHPRWLLAACVVFALPILDTGLAVVRRLLAGKKIFAGDRSHLYDQLVDRGMTVKQVVVLFYVLSAAAAFLAVFLAIELPGHVALLIYVVLLVVIVLIFYLLGMMTPPPKDAKKNGG